MTIQHFFNLKMGQLGEKIKQLRESNGLLQKDIAKLLGMDTPMLCKIEHGERYAKREHVSILSNKFNVDEQKLLSLWLSDKIYDVVKDEEVALEALMVTERQVKQNQYSNSRK